MKLLDVIEQHVSKDLIRLMEENKCVCHIINFINVRGRILEWIQTKVNVYFNKVK